MAKKDVKLTALKARRLIEKMKKDKLQGNYTDDLNEDSGEIQGSFDLDLDDSVFTNEIVKPEMSWWDKTDLYKELYRQNDKYNEEVDKTGNGQKYNINNIPKFVTYDLYSLFNNPIKDMSFVKPTPENQWQFDLTQKFNDYLLRVVTENNTVNSFITTNEFIKMLSWLVEQEKQKPENQGKSDEECLKQVSQRGINGSDGEKKQFQKYIEQTKKNIEEKQEQVKNAGGLQASKSDSPFEFKEIGELLDFASAVKHMPLNHKFIANFVNKSLKFSHGYFSNVYKQYEESILDSDTVDHIENYEELLPVFRNMNIEDLITKFRKYNLSFDIFIDNSGSMESHYHFDGKSVSGFDLCKITALKLNNMNLVKDVYLFNDSYKKVDKLDKIFGLRTYGGTNIDNVVNYVNKTKRPAVVLTDMQDTIHQYSDKIFFIGILDSRFDFRDNAKKFSTSKQCVKFVNGKFQKS